jgi:NAD(P)-dependent dehydrogenase (short-subunit alcohol dehydrogenase family)
VIVAARGAEAADGFPRQSRHPGDARRPCQDAADHEFAAVAAFLASDDAAYITATGLVVDGSRLTV